jgi:heterogeneous nuclear ribonucleoprotein F/H
MPQIGRGAMQTGMPMQQQGVTQVRRTGGGIQVGEHTGFLRMRGLPFTTTKAEIVAFFEGYNPIPDSVVLTYRNDRRATGEGYVQFESPDDAKNAMVLHKKLMGSRYIELFISNKDEHSRAFARFGDRE